MVHCSNLNGEGWVAQHAQIRNKSRGYIRIIEARSRRSEVEHCAQLESGDPTRWTIRNANGDLTRPAPNDAGAKTCYSAFICGHFGSTPGPNGAGCAGRAHLTSIAVHEPMSQQRRLHSVTFDNALGSSTCLTKKGTHGKHTHGALYM